MFELMIPSHSDWVTAVFILKSRACAFDHTIPKPLHSFMVTSLEGNVFDGYIIKFNTAEGMLAFQLAYG